MAKAPLSRADKGTAVDDPSTRSNGNIAAIDFGTTSLSLSYTTVGDDTINVFSFDTKSNVPRVPNAILLQKKELDGGKRSSELYDVVSIGTTAQVTFHKMRASQRKDYVYFERIKMMLMRGKEIGRESHVMSVTGESFYLIEVIAFILKHMAFELVDRLGKGVKPLGKHEFDWVITVPAIWNAQGKRLMREAVYLSGILTKGEGITKFSPVPSGVDRPAEINPEKLMLALEPEAAAIYSQIICRQQAKTIKREMSTGYMVVDAGGGTIDITAQIEVKGGVKIVSVPTGNTWGGTQVNEAFSKKFQKIVNDKDYDKYLYRSSGSSAASAANFSIASKVELDKFLYVEFEAQKVSFGQDKITEIAVLVPQSLVKFYGPDTILEGVEIMEGYEYEDDTLYITKEASEELFSEALTAISECMLEALSPKNCQVSSRDIGTVYLVGGFGSCNLVHRRLERDIKSHFPRIDVILPTSPLLAIVQGAVMGRQDPDWIQARPSDATYGIVVAMHYDSSIHDLRYHFVDPVTKTKLCRDVFEVFLLKGESASYKDTFKSDVSVPSDDAKEVTLTIYSTQKEGVQYVNTPEGAPLADKIGQLVVNAPNPDKLPLSKRRIEVSMSFSGTEIQAKAKYSATKKEVKTVCDFLSPA